MQQRMTALNQEGRTRGSNVKEYQDDDDFYSDDETESTLTTKSGRHAHHKLGQKSFIGRKFDQALNALSMILLKKPLAPKKELSARERRDLPNDYYVNPKYHENAGPGLVYYLTACIFARQVAVNDYFNYGVILTICTAGINVGVQTYTITDQGMILLLVVLDALIWIIFGVECLVKIMAEGVRPMRYFNGPEYAWNCFDFAIVVLSAPGMDQFFAGSGSIALLRLVRLARLGKLIKKIPQLQMIVQGLIGGLSSITYIIILLFLVFYLYAVIGFYLFRFNDPFHFGSLLLSLTTLFRVATLANWGDVMYLNMFGCDKYPVYYYFDNSVLARTDEYAARQQALWAWGNGTSQPTNSSDADLFAAWNTYNEVIGEPWVNENMYHCAEPAESLSVAPIYFISFVVISALVMLSLFIGAVTMSMTDSMDELSRITEEKKRMNTFEKNRKKILSLMSAVSMSDNVRSIRNKDDDGSDTGSSVKGQPNVARGAVVLRRVRKSVHMLSFGKVFKEEFAEENTSREHLEHKMKMTRALQFAMGEMAYEQRIADEEKFRQEGLDDYGLFWTYFSDVCDKAKEIREHAWFVNFVTFVIIVAGCNVGAQTDKRVTGDDAFCNREPDDDKEVCPTLENLDIVILVVFTFEMIVMILAEKFKPLRYLNDGWNVFDAFIVAASWIAFILNMGGEVAILRLLRLLRVLKLVKSLPQLAMIVNALIMGLSSIGYVGVILLLTFYVFAILGIILFADNDPWHFGTLHDAMITLFRASTLDDWAELMYLQQYNCIIFPEVYEDYPDMCDEKKANAQYYVALIYFGIFIMIAAQVLLTLFIGVISTSMDQAREAQKKDEKIELHLKACALERGLEPAQVAAFREVFEMLDLDKGGTIEEDELVIGLKAIGQEMEPYEIQELMRKVNPEGDGINVVGFIKFMCLTPKYKEGATAHRALMLWNKLNGKEKKAETKFQKWWRKFKQNFYTASYLQSLRTEAAMIIQSAWRAFVEDRHARGKDNGNTAAYDALHRRLQAAEEELIRKEKERLAEHRSTNAENRTVDDLMQQRILEEEMDRNKWGNEFTQRHKEQQQT
jgi:voltage-gated sodium channel